jgi:hypothetical protein
MEEKARNCIIFSFLAGIKKQEAVANAKFAFATASFV